MKKVHDFFFVSQNKHTIQMHIGRQIQKIVKQQGRTVTWLASQIPCDRSNMYLIFKKSAIDTDLLEKISKILNHDFFKDISEDTFSQKDRTDCNI